eukprot:174126-Pelagomonas_calceolata.AAC.6
MHLYAQSSAQQTLRLIRTKNVEYPSFLSLEAVDFFHCSLRLCIIRIGMVKFGKTSKGQWWRELARGLLKRRAKCAAAMI